MNALLINPKYPDTYWSLKHALKFVSKKASHPPLGLITVAPLIPSFWKTKLIDLNIEKLTDDDLKWADFVFISAMSIQRKSAEEIIEKCKFFDKKIIAGGPLFTAEYEDFDEVDYLILNEAEITFPVFINDLFNGKTKRIYQTDEFADISNSPVPDYSLIKTSNYAAMNIQYTRGCPFNCEFCDITALFGYKVRHKTTDQIIEELNCIYETGWRDSVFFVDDNFIGNKKVLKNELLPAIIDWMEDKKHPFTFLTETSINLADDDDLMQLMVQAGFAKVFVGIESTEEASLTECNKTQNKKRDLIKCVKDIQSTGMEVTAGFIVGFDNDTPSIFQNQIDFIQKSGIISAMVGLLNAPKKTLLYQRLKKEGRIVEDFSGDNTNYSLNFIPKMNRDELMNGYQQIINGIYSSKAYYARVKSFLKDYNPIIKGQTKITFNKVMALFKSIFYIGIFDKNQKYYWNLFFWSLFRKPKVFPLAITYSIYGYHYRKIFNDLT